MNTMSTYQQLVDWLQSLPGFVGQLYRHQFTGDITTADRLMSRCEEYLSLLICIYRRGSEIEDDSGIELLSDIQELIDIVHYYCEHYQEWVLQLLDENTAANDLVSSSPVRVFRGTPGRPPYQLPKSQIEALMELGFSYATMARMLNVSPRTLRRRREEYGLPVGRHYSDISDNDLDGVVSIILQVGKQYQLWLTWH